MAQTKHCTHLLKKLKKKGQLFVLWAGEIIGSWREGVPPVALWKPRIEKREPVRG